MSLYVAERFIFARTYEVGSTLRMEEITLTCM